jgi:hypothetical protein
MYALAMTVFRAKLPENSYNHVLAPRRIAHAYAGCQCISRSFEASRRGTASQGPPLRVSAITSRLAAKTGMPRVGALIGLAHDLGKYSTAFQRYLSRVASDASMVMEPNLSLKGSVDHSTAGAQIIAHGLIRDEEEVAGLRRGSCSMRSFASLGSNRLHPS